MRIDELKRIAKENDYEYSKYSITHIFTRENIDNYIRINSMFENRIWISITDWCDGKDFNMLKAAVEFAETPPEDREKEEKDKENLPNWMTRCLGEPVRDCEVEVEGDGRMIPKFRAYFHRYKRMIYNIGVVNENTILVDFNGDWSLEHIFLTNDIRLMQSVGLKDEQGNEIYEGDLVEYRDGEESFKGEVGISCFGSYVKTENDYIRFEDFSNENTRIAGNCYVVGNIYEEAEE